MPKKPKRKGMSKNNITAQSNSALITKTIHKHMKATKRMPTVTQISEDTGISRQAISRHLKDLKLPSYLDKYKELTDDVMRCLLMACESGNVHAMKLFFQLTWRWKPPKINEPEETKETITKFIITNDSNTPEKNKEKPLTKEITSNQPQSQPEVIPLNKMKNFEENLQQKTDFQPGDPDDLPPFPNGWATF